MTYTGQDRVGRFFAHHGIKGQKWGVRRFQNLDGSLTSDGRIRYRAAGRIRREFKNPTMKDVEEIYRSLPDKERRLLTGSADDNYYEKGQEIDERSNIAKTSVIKNEKGEPVSFANLYDNGGFRGEIALATKFGEQYRGKGYASKAVKEVMDWYNRQGYKNIDAVYWTPHKSNTASINLGKKFGFEEVKLDDLKGIYDTDNPANRDYVYLRYKKKEG